jgi:hypothetical protein
MQDIFNDDVGRAAAYLAEALCYKPKGREFESR